MYIKTMSMNKAAYVTAMTGIEGEIVWENRWNSIFFPECDLVELYLNKYNDSVKKEERLMVDLIDFMKCRDFYNQKIQEDRRQGKHLQ